MRYTIILTAEVPSQETPNPRLLSELLKGVLAAYKLHVTEVKVINSDHTFDQSFRAPRTSKK